MPQQLTKGGMATIMTHLRLGPFLRRYGWVGYWLVFAALTLDVARNPGFVPHPEAVPYPWVPALVTVALLGVQAAGLNATLRPLSTTRSWRRVAAASGLALVFALLTLASLATDMPGYEYPPKLFALANVLVVPAAGAVLTLYPVGSNEAASSPDAAA